VRILKSFNLCRDILNRLPYHKLSYVDEFFRLLKMDSCHFKIHPYCQYFTGETTPNMSFEKQPSGMRSHGAICHPSKISNVNSSLCLGFVGPSSRIKRSWTAGSEMGVRKTWNQSVASQMWWPHKDMEMH